MKKILFALFAIVLAYSASAQRIGYGPKGGFNISMLSGDMDYKARFNFNVGGFVEYDFAPEWAAELSVLYSRVGGKLDNVAISLTETTDAKLRLDYISLPLVAKFYPLDGMNVFLGPKFSFLVGAKQKLGDGDYVSVKSSWKTFDFGLTVGTGYAWEFGLLAYIQYNVGLTDIYKGDESVRTGGLQIGIGWRF